MRDEAKAITDAEFAIAFFNNLHSATFPLCPTMRELARQTRMVLGTLEMLDRSTAEAWEEVLLEALDAAYQMGSASQVDLIPDENYRKVLHQIQTFGTRLDLETALREFLALNWCVQHRFERPGRSYVMIARTCLACMTHEYSFPDNDDPMLNAFRTFCARHSTCMGCSYPEARIDDD